MEQCIFCKIANKEVSAEIVYEDEKIIAFKDIHPLAPVHILFIPKRHIESVINITERDTELMGRLIIKAKEIADELGISEEGYKLLFRVGQHGGQEVKHIHLHLIGGAPLAEGIHSV